jgi:O-antigen/teichoic acid export membrane protein
MVCSLAAIFFLIRAIGISGYGLFSVLMAATALLVAALEIGLNTLIMRDLTLEDPRHPSLLESAWRLRHATSILYVTIGAGVALFFYAHGQHQLAGMSLLLGVAVPYTISGNLVQAGAYSYGLAAREAVVEAAAKLLWVVAVVLIYFIGGSWLIAAVTSLFLGGAPVLARRWLTGRRLHRGVSIPTTAVLARSAPLALFPFIYLAFDRTDILGLALTATHASVGQYSACYQFADAMVILAAAALTVLQPTYSPPEGRKLRHEQTRRRLLTAVSWMSALGIASSPLWLRIIAGSQLGSPYVALTTVTLLGTGTIAYVAVQCDIIALVAAHRSAKMFFILASGAVAEFALVAWLGHYSIAVTAGLVCALEFAAVTISSHLCTRAGLSSGLLRGSAPAIVLSVSAAALEFILGPSIPVALLACALCGFCGILTPSARGEAFSVLTHVPYIGPPMIGFLKAVEHTMHLPTTP